MDSLNIAPMAHHHTLPASSALPTLPTSPASLRCQAEIIDASFLGDPRRSSLHAPVRRTPPKPDRPCRPTSMYIARPTTTPSMSRDELTAKIANSFQEFSIMLNHMAKQRKDDPHAKMTPTPSPTDITPWPPVSQECQPHGRKSTSSLSSAEPLVTTSPSCSSSKSDMANNRASRSNGPMTSTTSTADTNANADKDADKNSDTDTDSETDESEKGMALLASVEDISAAARGVDKESDDGHRIRRNLTRMLTRAASSGDTATIKAVLDGPDLKPFVAIDGVDHRGGSTPLMYAACFGHLEIARILLDAGAQVDVQDKQGWTALMWAASNNHTEIARLLLDHGASATAQSVRGQTASDLISDKTNMDMQQLLPPIQRHSCDDIPPKNTPPSPTPRPQRPIRDEIERIYFPGPTDGYHHFLNPSCPTTPANATHTASASANANAKTNNDKESCVTDEDVKHCEASMRSVHYFEWNRCLADQMFVFSADDISHIIDTIVIDAKQLSVESPDDLRVPANVVFLCTRFAHYYANRDLLHTFLGAACTKMTKAVKSNARNLHMLAYWITNLYQLVAYLKRDTGLAVSTVSEQKQLSDLLEDAFALLVIDCQKRLDKWIVSAMLDYEEIQELEQVSFPETTGWHRLFRRASMRMLATPAPVPQPHPNNNRHSISSVPRGPTPDTITSHLASVMDILRSYDVHPTLVDQAIIHAFSYVSHVTCQHMLHHKIYLCRSKAVQVRMNVSAFEEWSRYHCPAVLSANCFALITQLLQLLQCVSQLDDLTLFQYTVKTLDQLTPNQVRRCVVDYRYETSETRLPPAIVQWVEEAAHAEKGSVDKKLDAPRLSFQSDDGTDATLEFTLPTRYAPRTMPPSQANDATATPISEAMYEKFWRQRIELDTASGKQDRRVMPTIPEYWIARLDGKRAPFIG